ncbi:lysoplasmalogenase [Nocardioides sp. HDW12B]|uniref:lysoplasmalogenase n=1 Tax=Nocardioides sp. HDW12B TaxID=2714939 RepID=UPI00140CFDBD|nr:lysoplasmalogenase [Nocardioides sp. HDW12B]QIK66145.1 lysoplasmalogenase [Nocardioides sp. HDW12B]
MPLPPPTRRAYLALSVVDTALAGLGARGARRATKPLLMPVLAHGFAASTRGSSLPVRRATLAAQLLSGCGDVALLGRGKRPFLAGLGSFLAAHGAYVVGFTSLRSPAPLDPAATRGPRLAAAAFLVAGPVLARAAGRTSPGLRTPVLVYAGALCGMVATASRIGPPADAAARRQVVAGTALFLVSDGLLGTREFLLPDSATGATGAAGAGGTTAARRILDVAVMATYTAAQGLIASGVADAVHPDPTGQAAGTAST